MQNGKQKKFLIGGKMNNKIEYWKWIKREDLKNNLHKLFLFGDNLMRIGNSGQAKEMRGEPNSLGIITKKYPTMAYDAFIYDRDFEYIKDIIDKDFEKIPNNIIVVIPSDGLGTGLARLPETSPLLFKYIKDKIEELQ